MMWRRRGTRAGEGAGGEGEEEEAYSRRRPLSPLAVARPVAAGREERRGSCTGARGEGSGGWGKKKRTGIV